MACCGNKLTLLSFALGARIGYQVKQALLSRRNGRVWIHYESAWHEQSGAIVRVRSIDRLCVLTNCVVVLHAQRWHLDYNEHCSSVFITCTGASANSAVQYLQPQTDALAKEFLKKAREK
jgi:hypothetical protein